MAKTAASNVLTVKGVDLSKIFRGQQMAVFSEGTDVYTSLRTGQIVLDDGTVKIECEAKAKFVGSLFNMARDYGRESIYSAGQIFDPAMIFDKLDDAGMEVDPRSLYTVVLIFIPPSAPTTGI